MFALASFDFALASAEVAQAPYTGVCRFSAPPQARFRGPRGYLTNAERGIRNAELRIPPVVIPIFYRDFER